MAAFALILHAQTPDGHHRRAWELHMVRDLLGDLVIEVLFGRIEAEGCNRLRMPVRDEGEARDVVRQLVRRRMSAPLRIGAPYRVIACRDPDGWLERAGIKVLGEWVAVGPLKGKGGRDGGLLQQDAADGRRARGGTSREQVAGQDLLGGAQLDRLGEAGPRRALDRGEERRHPGVLVPGAPIRHGAAKPFGDQRDRPVRAARAP
jgi:hypothetical protein